MKLGNTHKAYKEGWHSCSVSWRAVRERLLRDIAKLEEETDRLGTKYHDVCSLVYDFQRSVKNVAQTRAVHLPGH